MTETLKQALSHALPLLPKSSSARRTPSGSSTRTTSFSPALPSPKNDANGTLSISCSAKALTTAAVSFPPGGVISAQFHENPTSHKLTITLRLTSVDPSVPESDLAPRATQALWSTLFCYVAAGQTAPAELEVELPLPSPVLHRALMALGAELLSPTYRLTRSALWETFAYASAGSTTTLLPFPYVSSKSGELSHPLRPPKPTRAAQEGRPLYSRYIPHLGQYFRIDPVDARRKADVDTVHEWMNNPRVDEFWMEKGTWEAHEQFLLKHETDTHVIPVIGSYVDLSSPSPESSPLPSSTNTIAQTAIYSEVYWVSEDRLAPLMEKEGKPARDYDRGLHVLVGSEAHRGAHRVRAWLPSLVHYCFLDDPRTERVIAEPNEKNPKMIQYFESAGFVRHGSVTFPHKVSALMICEKRAFYESCPF